MKEKKLFSFQFEDRLKERLLTIAKRRQRSMAFLINEAIESKLNRDRDAEIGVKKNEETYGPMDTPDISMTDILHLKP
jgi:predicted transcriptional regulator